MRRDAVRPGQLSSAQLSSAQLSSGEVKSGEVRRGSGEGQVRSGEDQVGYLASKCAGPPNCWPVLPLKTSGGAKTWAMVSVEVTKQARKEARTQNVLHHKVLLTCAVVLSPPKPKTAGTCSSLIQAASSHLG